MLEDYEDSDFTGKDLPETLLYDSISDDCCTACWTCLSGPESSILLERKNQKLIDTGLRRYDGGFYCIDETSSHDMCLLLL